MNARRGRSRLCASVLAVLVVLLTAAQSGCTPEQAANAQLNSDGAAKAVAGFFGVANFTIYPGRDEAEDFDIASPAE